MENTREINKNKLDLGHFNKLGQYIAAAVSSLPHDPSSASTLRTVLNSCLFKQNYLFEWFDISNRIHQTEPPGYEYMHVS